MGAIMASAVTLAARTNLLIGWVALAALAFWLWPGSGRLWINPTAAAISGGVVTVHRTFPLSDWTGGYRPQIAYVETVHRLDGTLPPCVDTGGFRYNPARSVASWQIGEWAARCIDGSFVWRAEWTPYALGLIPMRPVALEVVVLNPNGDVP
jgi:hypothetical protein